MPNPQPDAALLAEMRNMLEHMRENGRKFDVFIEEFSSVLPDLRTEVSLLKQVQVGHEKHIDEHCQWLHKGENSLLSQVLIMRQEMKELILRSSGYITIAEKMINLENRVKTNEIATTDIATAIKESPKTTREKGLYIAQWVGMALLVGMWLWDKFHK